MANSVLSVLIPNLNKARRLHICLDSIINQSMPKDMFNVFVMDGGSSDASLSVINSYSKELNISISTQLVPGLYVAWNILLDLVNTPYFCFLTSDDAYHPDFLQTSFDLLEANQMVNISLSRCNQVPEQESYKEIPELITLLSNTFGIDRTVAYPQRALSLLNTIIPGYYGSFHNLFIRTKFLKTISGSDLFPLMFGSHGDSCVFNKLASFSPVLVASSEIYNKFFIGSDTATAKSIADNEYIYYQLKSSVQWMGYMPWYLKFVVFILCCPYRLYMSIHHRKLSLFLNSLVGSIVSLMLMLAYIIILPRKLLAFKRYYAIARDCSFAHCAFVIYSRFALDLMRFKPYLVG
jgi:glycosyltransferase involved in cell wall biosynthesis